MNSKGFFKRAAFSAIAVALTGLTAFASLTGIVNGDFSIPDLNGWTFSDGVSDGDPYTTDSGYAFFYPDVDPNSTLSQDFYVPGDVQTLSFDVNMIWSGSGGGDTDEFTAYLNGSAFYSINNADSNSGNIIETVTYDISDFNNQLVSLAFELTSDFEDEKLATVSLDNVALLVPAPGALLLGLIGTGAVGLWRKVSRRA